MKEDLRVVPALSGYCPPGPTSPTPLAEGTRLSLSAEPGSKALLKRLVRAGDARGRRTEGGWVTRRLSHHRPIVVSGQRVAGASFSGWEESPAKRPRKGACWQLGALWRGCHRLTGSPPRVSKPVPLQSLTKAALGQGSRRAGQVSTARAGQEWA